MDTGYARLGVSIEAIAEFCRRWRVSEFALFGSAVRENFREHSDVDVLVSFEPGTDQSLEDIAAMEEELRAFFGRKVDLVEKRLIGRNPYRRYNILAEYRVLYPEPRPGALSVCEGPARYDRDLGYVWDIVQAGREIMTLTSHHDSDTDRTTRLAIERLLGIIDEAVRGLSPTFRAGHPEIPWSTIIAARNILIHNDRDVEEEKVWRIALDSVPRLVEELAPLVVKTP